MSSGITAELVDISDLTTPIAALPDTLDRQWQEMLSDTGSAKLSFLNGDEALALIDPPNSLVNFYDNHFASVRTSDSFNRANSAVTMGSTDGGSTVAWVPNSGTWGISSNQAYETTGGGGQHTTVVDTGLADCTIEVTFSAFDDCGLCWRSADDNNNWLTNGGNAFKRVSGGFTSVGANFGIALGRGVQTGDRMRVVVQGDDHEIWVQPGGTGAYVLVASFTDSFNNAATKHGLRSNASLAGADKFDDFLVVRSAAGAVLAFTMLCEKFEATLVAENEESVEITIWSGRGHSAVLDRAQVYPSNGVDSWPIQEDRAMDFTDPFCFDDSDWDPAEIITDVATAKTSWPGALWAPTYPDDDGFIVAAPGDTLTTAVLGTRRCRQRITVANTNTYNMYYEADDRLELFIDGSPVASTDRNQNFTQLNQASVDLTAGDHVVAWSVTNMPWAGPDANPCGASWVIYEPIYGGAIIARADSSGKVLFSNDTPGMTPGAAILCLLGEAQARETLADLLYVTTSFDETNDTAGNAWPVVPDISTKVGTSLLTFLKELSATYIDWDMAPGTFVLDAWAVGGMGTTTGVDFHSPTDPEDPATGNLASHKETGEA